MLKKVIGEIVGIPLIDSAVETAREVSSVLADNGLLCQEGNMPVREFFVTDAPEKFVSTGEKFLEHPIKRISKVRAYRQAGLIRYPEVIEKTGFRLKDYRNDKQRNTVYTQTLVSVIRNRIDNLIMKKL